MSTRYIIANWKMQLDPAESARLAGEVVRLWAAEGAGRTDPRVVLCASHVALTSVGAALKGTGVALGAQDCFWEDKGTYTGEISAAYLKQLGCEYCLTGHSERREFLGETDEMANRKTIAIIRHRMTPIVCVGETMDERQAGKRDAVVIGQVRAALAGVHPVGTQSVIVAYEPRWAISDGRTGQPVVFEDIVPMHRLILDTLHEMYAADVVARQFSIIYGGSSNSKNIGRLMESEYIHGFLVGGAALKADEFVRMARLLADSVSA